MKWGLFTSGYHYESLESAFRDARDFGYDFIELWGGRPHAYAPDLLAGDLKPVLALCVQYGLPIHVYTPEHNAYPYNYMLGSERQFEDCIAYFESALLAGRALGADYVLFSLSHAGKQPDPQRLVRTMERLGELSGRLSQAILLENLTPFESNQYCRLEDYAALIGRLPSPAFHAICDVVVPFVQGESPADYVRRLGKRLKHLHLVDSDGVSETHLIPGEGCMQLKDLLRDVSNLGYTGTATIELVTHYEQDPHQAAEKAIRQVRQWEEENQAHAASQEYVRRPHENRLYRR